MKRGFRAEASKNFCLCAVNLKLPVQFPEVSSQTIEIKHVGKLKSAKRSHKSHIKCTKEAHKAK